MSIDNRFVGISGMLIICHKSLTKNENLDECISIISLVSFANWCLHMSVENAEFSFQVAEI